jgi:hypothetical protein
MIRTEERRLKSLFQKIILASLAMPGAIQACSSSTSGPPADGGTPDASMNNNDSGMGGMDAGADTGGGNQDSGNPTGDAGDGGMVTCTVSDPYDSDAGIVYDAAGVDGGENCYYFRDYSCGPSPNFPPASNCYLTLSDCANICPSDAGSFFDCKFWEGYGCTDGGTTWASGEPARIGCGICAGVGRRPEGLEEPAACDAESELGDYFARAAHLESASVHAFRALVDELQALGAPASLVKMAGRSAEDEVRHARATRRLARRFGGVAPRVRVRRPARRALLEIAIENAVEGCVRETFGAMVASWQAANAVDARIRRSMARIAEDETRHAALAWALARWIEPKLDEAGRARVARARARAVKDLLREAESPPATTLVSTAGLPNERVAKALASELRAALWS